MNTTLALIEKIKHPPVVRQLRLLSSQRVTPNLQRLVVTGDELATFVSLAPDDHVKVLVTQADGSVVKRSYTPHSYDASARSLALDVVVHREGPVTRWALAVQPGDTVTLAGPNKSTVVPHVFDWHLLIGDETALPAIAQRVRTLPADVQVLAVVAVAGPEEHALLPHREGMQVHWVHRPALEAHRSDGLLAAVKGLTLPKGRGFAWVGCEAQAVRDLRAHLLETRGHPLAALKATGYWTAGRAGTSQTFDTLLRESAL